MLWDPRKATKEFRGDNVAFCDNGGEVLSVFGDRAETGEYITRKLIDPAFVAELDTSIFDSATARLPAWSTSPIASGVPTGNSPELPAEVYDRIILPIFASRRFASDGR